MKIFSLVISLLLASHSAHAASAHYSPAELKKLWRNTSSKQRKLVTSNSVHFWAWAKNEAAEHLGDLLKAEGIVIGDPHPGNVFDYRASASGEATLAVADIDDGGRAPLVLDLARYITYLEAADIGTKVGAVFEAYVAGLTGEAAPASSLWSEAKGYSPADIETQHTRYLQKRSAGGKLDHEELELKPEAELSKAQRQELQKLEKQTLVVTGLAKIWDAGYKENDSGSSAGMGRYWMLAGTAKEPTRLLEAKELSRPAVDYYETQLGDERRVPSVVKAYSAKGLEPQLFAVVKAGKTYWLRPRKFQILDLKDDEVTKAEAKAFALLVAHWMGAQAAKQPGGATLAKKLEADPHGTKEAIESFVRAYLAEMESLRD